MCFVLASPANALVGFARFVEVAFMVLDARFFSKMAREPKQRLLSHLEHESKISRIALSIEGDPEWLPQRPR